MAIRKLETGQFHKLPFSEINLKPLPKLKQALQTYYETGDFLLDALSHTKSYSKGYLNTTYVTVVQNTEKLSVYFLIGSFEILHIIDRYPQKYLAYQSVHCLVCEMPA